MAHFLVTEAGLHTALLSTPTQPTSKILLLVQNSMLLGTLLIAAGSATVYLMGIRNGWIQILNEDVASLSLTPSLCLSVIL